MASPPYVSGSPEVYEAIPQQQGLVNNSDEQEAEMLIQLIHGMKYLMRRCWVVELYEYKDGFQGAKSGELDATESITARSACVH